ncbi:tail fiber assembly protein [Yersinia enterocolitica]
MSIRQNTNLAKLIEWQAYVEVLEAIDTSSTPAIKWSLLPVS